MAAEETDSIRTRSNIRGEDVYLYRLQLDQPALQHLFLAFVDKAQALERTPEFYNTLTSNCTTILHELAAVITPLPWDYRILLSGHVAQYLYERGALDSGQPFAQLQQAGHINVRAIQADRDAQPFSTAIRAGVPGIND